MTFAVADAGASGTSLEQCTIPFCHVRLGSWRFSIARTPLTATDIAPLYDQKAIKWSQTIDRMGFLRAYRQVAENALDAKSSFTDVDIPRVLDCGVGTGALSVALNEVSRKPFRLDAIDISNKMLERARHEFTVRGINAATRCADVRNLPYEDAQFDMVLAAHVLEHLEEPGPALTEMTRVLKPGGLLVVCVTRKSLLGALVHMRWRTHRVTLTRSEFWLKSLGLEDISSRPLEPGFFCRRLSLACRGRKPQSN